MKKISLFILFFSILSAIVAKTNEPQPFVPNAQEKKLAEFLKGVEFLSIDNALSEDEKAIWYKKLCNITGLTTEDAVKLVEKYSDTPKKWGELLSYVSTSTPDTIAVKQYINKNDTLKNREKKNGKIDSTDSN